MHALRTLTLAVVTLLTGGAALAADGPLELGAALPAADVKLKNVDGRALTLADAAGKQGTLVIFACNHCPWVKAWETRLAAIGNHALEQGVGVVMINSNDPGRYPEDGFPQMNLRAKERGYAFPYVVDARSAVARAFGASHTPEVFLFDKQGKLAYHGTVDDNAQDAKAVKQHFLSDALEALVAGKEIPVKQTKALGCGIKFWS